MCYVYVLKSLKDGKLYVGHTNDLKKRFQEHNMGLTKSTNIRKPFKLVYYEACNILNDAIKREIFKNWLWKSILKKKIKRCLKYCRLYKCLRSNVGPPASLREALRAGERMFRQMQFFKISKSRASETWLIHRKSYNCQLI